LATTSTCAASTTREAYVSQIWRLHPSAGSGPDPGFEYTLQVARKGQKIADIGSGVSDIGVFRSRLVRGPVDHGSDKPTW
jgi:hypothetical protein